MQKIKKTNKISSASFIIGKEILIYLSILVIGLSFFCGYLFAKSNRVDTVLNAAIPSPAPQAKRPEINFDALPSVDNNDHIKGNKNAKAILIEYSDFECPFSKRFSETMVQLTKDYGDKVARVYRHYPLAFHTQAQALAEASECAADIGGNDGFWKMHDAIFTKTPDIKIEDLPNIAAGIGINKTKFSNCMSSGKFKDKVIEQFEKGQQAGVSGTPGTFVIGINNKKEFISGALPVEEAKKIIDKVLN